MLAEINLIFFDNDYVLYIHLLSYKSQINSESMELLFPSDSFAVFFIFAIMLYVLRCVASKGTYNDLQNTEN
jgi:hypothetical protein